MNILFISDMFPTEKKSKRTEKSYVLHTFLKNWQKDNDVKLLMVFPREKQLKSDLSSNRLSSIFKKHGILNVVKHIYEAVFPSAQDIEEYDCQGVKGFKIWLIKYWRKHFIVRNIKIFLENSSFKPDVLISHLPFGILVANPLNKYLKLPHIHGVHAGDLYFYSHSLYKSKYNKVDCFVYRSPAMEKRAQKAGLKSDYSKVLPSGIEKSLIIEQVRSFDFNKGVKFLSVCSLIKLKNINYNLIALSNLPANINWEYTIIGSGEEEQYLKQLACDLDISKRVHFKGFLDRDKCLDEMFINHIYLQVSAPETLGMVYLEAMAKGMIIIGCKGYGVDGLVIDGENGFLCMPENSEDLKDKILEILNYTNLDLILQNALSSIRELTEERACADYLKFIKKVVSQNRRKLN